MAAPPSADPPPDSLAAGQTLPAVGGEGRGHGQLVLETARLRSGWALLGTYDDAAGRRFGLTTDLGLVPLDRAKMVRPSAFRGVALSPELGLPVAFVRSKAARAFERLGGGPLAARRLLPWREPLVLTGRELDLDAPYLEIRDGSWVRAEQVTVVPRPNPTPPGWARRGQKWIDVSLLRQTLVAYEGLRPVYATMVSTGQGGAGDPATTHATVQGAFLIHTKHVSVTMDGDAAGDEFDLRDVPWVQYFSEGYALHGVYWHDDFGTARSHGCVNLAPLDAAWLFRWTTPEVPAGWHAALSLKHGTVVYIHP